MNFRFWASGFGFRVQSLGFSAFWLRVEGLQDTTEKLEKSARVPEVLQPISRLDTIGKYIFDVYVLCACVEVHVDPYVYMRAFADRMRLKVCHRRR